MRSTHVVPIAVAAMALPGCAGDDETESTGSGRQEAALRFAQCMRELEEDR